MTRRSADLARVVALPAKLAIAAALLAGSASLTAIVAVNAATPDAHSIACGGGSDLFPLY